MEGSCDCGTVRVTLPDVPEVINACPCAYCVRVGARWAYFPRGSVGITGRTEAYRRATRTIEFRRCAVCGGLTHWIDPDGRVKHMGVNMRNFDPDAVAGIAVVVDP